LARNGRVKITGLETLMDEGAEPVKGTRGVSTFLGLRKVESGGGVSGGDRVERVGGHKGSGEGPHYDQQGWIGWKISRHRLL